MKFIFSPTMVVTAIITALGFSAAHAANIPAGIKLAEKQELVRNNEAEVTSLDPHKVEGVPESQVLNDLLEGLVVSNPDGKIAPGVAERWENSGFKVWTFHLRKEAKWSNGDPVTAADFVYSWQRLADPTTGSPYASYLEYAKVENISDIVNGKKSPETLGVKALDPHTLQITLTEPVPYLDKMLFHTSVKPVNKKTVEQFGDKWTQPANWVGNGAYSLKQWVVNERIVLQRNPHYWDDAKTAINQVTYLPISSEVTAVNRYRSGEIDMTGSHLPIDMFPKLRKELPQELHITPYLCTYYFEMNLAKPPFDNLKVRQALTLATDRELVTDKVKNQGDQPAYSFTPPYTDGIMDLKRPEWASLTQQQRNEEGKKLLVSAGYSKEQPLQFNLLYNTSDLHQKLAIALSSIWKKNLDGLVNVKMENQEWKTFLDNRRVGNYQMARAGWCADYNEPSAFLNTLLSNSSNNRSNYKSPVFDNIIKQTLTASDDTARAKLYQQAEAQLDKDAVIVPLYFYAITRLVKPHVGAYSDKNPQDEMQVKDLYIQQH